MRQRPAADDAILALFREWIAAYAAADALIANDKAHSYTDENMAVPLDRAQAAEDGILDIPASGAIGLAIKGYLTALIVRWDDRDSKDPSGALGRMKPENYRTDGTLDRESRTTQSLARENRSDRHQGRASCARRSTGGGIRCTAARWGCRADRGRASIS